MPEAASERRIVIGKPDKKTYRAPCLVRYGGLRELTQTGTGTVNENSKNCTKGYTLNGKACSDENAKQNLLRIGEHPAGMGLYLFDYKPEFRDKWGHGRQFGVMAQEVEKIMPEAVAEHPDGYKMVDYELLGIYRSDH